MKHTTHKLTLALLAVFCAACGPDPELVASGKAHSCNLKKATDAAAENPSDPKLAKAVEDHAALLKTVIETADEGKRAALETAIAEAVAKGC